MGAEGAMEGGLLRGLVFLGEVILRRRFGFVAACFGGGSKGMGGLLWRGRFDFGGGDGFD